MWFAAEIAVRVAAINYLKRRSSNEFACEVFGAVFVDSMSCVVRYSFNFIVSCSLAPSVCSRCAFLSQIDCIFERDLMIALAALLFCFIIWISVQPMQASTMIWMYLFPSMSGGVIGPVVSDDISSRRLYLLCVTCLNGALVALLSTHSGHDCVDCVTLTAPCT
eukprot:Plantae.Rhodophyta-Palmaria_palmata.ctg970.p1 GENE.Plantae.Rhodophyta-Palmaria_palmata.ctg970~~Plantae.Rhodophyta-Palmaria_palmata.ctg970.p1  ORF type:complete len:164 (-),score=9.94 Plantae.Rhodophyta-Palmaria_palmata.ctg970:283-774(-)